MKIALRGGHSSNCLGAIGIKNEWLEMQKLYKEVERILTTHGHVVINCNSTERKQLDDLAHGVNLANKNGADLFMSLHMNCYNGTAFGTESWLYSSNSAAKTIANRLVSNFSKLGFYNRGVKVNPKYYELHHNHAPAIIFETAFCDSLHDCNLMDHVGYTVLAYNICNAIDSSIKDIGVTATKNTVIKIKNGNVNKVGIVTASKLNVRSGRGINNDVIGTLNKGDKVDLWYCLNDWVSIGFKGRTGYINANYVNIQ